MNIALSKVDQLLDFDIMICKSIPLLQGNVVFFFSFFWRGKCSHLDLAYKLNCKKEVSVSDFHSIYTACCSTSLSSNFFPYL